MKPLLIALLKELTLCADILAMISSILAAMAGRNSAPYVLLICVPLSLLYGRLVEMLEIAGDHSPEKWD